MAWALFCSAFVLFPELNLESVHVDEYITLMAAHARDPMDAGMYVINTEHPPGWGILAWLWGNLVGRDIQSLRLLSAISGTLGCMLWARNLTRFLPGPAAVTASVLTALWPWLVLQNRQAVVYGFYLVVTAVHFAAARAFLSHLMAEDSRTRTHGGGRAFLYSAAGLIHLLTFNLAPAFLLADNLAWLFMLGRWSHARKAHAITMWLTTQLAFLAVVAGIHTAWLSKHTAFYQSVQSLTLEQHAGKFLRDIFSIFSFDFHELQRLGIRAGLAEDYLDFNRTHAGAVITGALALIRWAHHRRMKEASSPDSPERNEAALAEIQLLLHAVVPAALFSVVGGEFRAKAFFVTGIFAFAMLSLAPPLWLRKPSDSNPRGTSIALPWLLALAFGYASWSQQRELHGVDLRGAAAAVEESGFGPSREYPVVVHSAHMLCPFAWHAGKDLDACEDPGRAVNADHLPDRPGGDGLMVFPYRMKGPYHDAGSYRFDVNAALEELSLRRRFHVVIADHEFADPSLARLNEWMTPFVMEQETVLPWARVRRYCNPMREECAPRK
ncbi:MAG: hypothetical protein GMKNLPBB_00635 [Myxococcota bacterium]|nr:hypothetical protein [Myxococcota bacterium]